MLKSYTKLTSGQFNSEKHKTYYQLLPQYYSKNDFALPKILQKILSIELATKLVATKVRETNKNYHRK